MAHNRTAIREALKTILLNNTDAGSNVYSNRRTALWKSELPAILIYSNSETAQLHSMQGSRYLRTLELTVEVRLENSSDVDTDVDALVASVETLIANDLSLGGTVQATTLLNSETRVDSEAEKDVGVGVLTYECKYTA